MRISPVGRMGIPPPVYHGEVPSLPKKAPCSSFAPGEEEGLTPRPAPRRGGGDPHCLKIEHRQESQSGGAKRCSFGVDLLPPYPFGRQMVGGPLGLPPPLWGLDRMEISWKLEAPPPPGHPGRDLFQDGQQRCRCCPLWTGKPCFSSISAMRGSGGGLAVGTGHPLRTGQGAQPRKRPPVRW